MYEGQERGNDYDERARAYHKATLLWSCNGNAEENLHDPHTGDRCIIFCIARNAVRRSTLIWRVRIMIGIINKLMLNIESYYY